MSKKVHLSVHTHTRTRTHTLMTSVFRKPFLESKRKYTYGCEQTNIECTHATQKKAKCTLQMIYMQAGWSRVKQTEGPKHTNTSGDYSAGAIVVLHQMLLRGPTTSTDTHTHTLRIMQRSKCVPRLNNHYVRFLSLTTAPIHAHTQECAHINTPSHSDLHKHIPADLDLPSACVRTR